MIVKYTKDAVNDLVRLREFIEKSNPENAARVASKIIQITENIVHTPLIGLRLANYAADVRELNIGRYVFRYLIEAEVITILRIWHGREIKA